MKTLVAVLLGSSMVLSFSAEAVPCRDIASAVVDQYVAIARYKVETPEQIEAYSSLVDSQISACAEGKKMRLRGGSAKNAGVAMTLAAAQAVDRGNSKSSPGLNAVAMTQVSFSYGYAFGE
ncbi:MAG: hypothetical protein ACRCZO_16055 [Cetobacterium sp.]